MTENRNNPIRHQRRRGVITVGVGAAAGALLAAALSQLATAPTARADDFTDIVANVDTTIAAGQADFTAGQADFALSTPAGFADGVAFDVEGTNDVLYGPIEDIIGGSAQALAGQTPTDVFEFGPAADPATLTDLQTFVTADFAIGTDEFNLADAEFALGTPAGFAAGVGESLSGFDFDAVLAPQQALIGLADLAGL
ncbi:MAG TPA: hypothetical protein VE485_15035 [Mycobacterium sp.]|jgi:hypothetical protein|nr:hypothetical protein [Mycobacterium sp.]